MKKDPVCMVLVGIPCSGKSIFAQNKPTYYVISRDKIRHKWFGKNYKQNNRDEKIITQLENEELEFIGQKQFHCIIDNTNLKQEYINNIKQKLPNHFIIYKYFDIPLWKAYYRNIIRWINTGKFIPFRTLNKMYSSYKKIKQNPYT